MKGVVAAGHPLTAEAGAEVLRDGGNAVDAAVAAVLMSFVTESPLTGPGAGGFMLVHTAGGEDHLLDFFVAAPGIGLDRPEPAELTPIDVEFAPEAVQVFNIGPSSCGVYGTPAGLAEALDRFGTAPLADLVGAPARAARDGRGGQPDRRVPDADPRADPHGPARGRTRSTRRTARCRARATCCGCPSWRTCSSGSARRGRASSTRARPRQRVSDWVLERGGLLTREDLASYAVEERAPARATLPRPRGAHEPAAVLGRHPDRVLARPARARRAARATSARS